MEHNAQSKPIQLGWYLFAFGSAGVVLVAFSIGIHALKGFTGPAELAIDFSNVLFFDVATMSSLLGLSLLYIASGLIMKSGNRAGRTLGYFVCFVTFVWFLAWLPWRWHMYNVVPAIGGRDALHDASVRLTIAKIAGAIGAFVMACGFPIYLLIQLFRGKDSVD